MKMERAVETAPKGERHEVRHRGLGVDIPDRFVNRVIWQPLHLYGIT